jgi:predicted MPP superfamily phosphohydrolase
VVGLFLSVPATFYLGRTLPPDRGAILLTALYTWVGVLFVLLVLVAATDLAQLAARLARQIGETQPPGDPERRVALARLMGGGVALVAGGATTAGVASALAPVSIREVRVALPRLPAALAGTTIVQLTDLHLGPTLRREFVEDVVARANALQPDVIAITGDLVDGSVEKLRELVAPLAKLRARHGTYFVTGNHEYYSGAAAWCEELTRLGVRVLRNERVSIGSNDTAFDLVGVDDYQAHKFGNGHGADLTKALAGADPERATVLLAHQPLAVHEAQERRVGLVLSGHTHGGQIWPWHLFVRLQQPVVRGLHRFGATQIYVSSGTGYWGPPMRLGAPAEITKIVLTPTAR